ncbi:heme ABC transporter ATP-binding protein [Halococcus qingdaonensis]|uniref:heme ABC transporter ATP-binding protein n=1 Tax=Halococcus qingdaonensis TaxID=224402 RepID=UPI0021165207|nr:heme ABC transporter ATP-binding protein [Halococcus qingdaonensis]
MIDVEDLSIAFGDVQALSDVNLTVDRGELVGLVGPNGAGKSTLLGTINGLLEPTAGRVTVDGDDVTELSARALARQVATVPQETSLSFAFPVRDVVAMGRTPYRSRFERVSPTDREHAERAMERTDVARFADRSIDAVSGGERQRVVVARALCQDPDALLLDEPTASLDIDHQVRILSLAREFVAEDRAALCAIHDLSLAARFCDRLALVADGELLATGTPESVLAEEHVEHAFGTEATVTNHPVTGTPDVTVTESRPDRDAHVHVLGGGHTASRAIAALATAGFSVSAGVLPDDDRALDTARAHDVDTVTAAPFAPVDGAVRREASQSVQAADCTVLAGTDETNRALAEHARRLVVVREAVGEAIVDERTTDIETARVTDIGELVTGVEARLDGEPRRLETPADD